jgi:hypothetical protein
MAAVGSSCRGQIAATTSRAGAKVVTSLAGGGPKRRREDVRGLESGGGWGGELARSI